MYFYQTRIKEHLHTVNAHLSGRGQDELSLKDVAKIAKVPYSTMLRYANDAQESPNFAVVDRVRMALNSYLPKREQFSDGGYIYSEDILGQFAASVSA